MCHIKKYYLFFYEIYIKINTFQILNLKYFKKETNSNLSKNGKNQKKKHKLKKKEEEENREIGRAHV